MKPKASEIAATENFIDDMIEFSTQSMQWCAKESEKATLQLSEVLTHLLNDAKRISIMSTEAVNLLKDFKTKAAAEGGGKELINGLQKLSVAEKDIHDFANPIISTLQFQDRITQMMNNMTSMIATWALMRSSVAGSDTLTAEDKIAFGQKLCECTNMIGLRALIRGVIPGMPEEKTVEDALMF